MKSLYLYAVSIAALGMTATLCSAEPGLQGRDMVTLETQSTSVGIDVGGGSIVDFHLKGHRAQSVDLGLSRRGGYEAPSDGSFLSAVTVGDNRRKPRQRTVCRFTVRRPESGGKLLKNPKRTAAQYVRKCRARSPWRGWNCTAQSNLTKPNRCSR